ncbi:MAG: 4a-hydroxytetrahydrobiopterin dehydratase [Carbonactinosporaceae bacterium]
MPLLDDADIARQLDGLDGWSGDRQALLRTVKAADFPTAIKMVDDIAEAAEEMNHHPDIDIRWRTLHISLVTHAAGGVTENDVTLARRIDEIVRKHPLA